MRHAELGKSDDAVDAKRRRVGAGGAGDGDGEPTRCVLLLNMVGRGHVDRELEAETAEECARFGAVRECVIFELLDARVPDTEAVRIFVHFDAVAAAVAAVAELDGRFFDGRAVRATYWDEAKFERRELI